MKTGYCCNVHGGTSLEEVKANLETYSCEVKRHVSPNEAMPIGLWLSESAIAGLGDASPEHIDATNAFGDWLADRGLDPFTFNGFPLGNFHQEVVKHDVYLPTWASKQRLDYTKQLATVQGMLLERAGQRQGLQSISTLPLGWPPVAKDRIFHDRKDFLIESASNLRSLAKFLSELKNETGRHVIVCLEPEPGCALDSCHEITWFFEQFLFDCPSQQQDQVRDHLGVCHDICHSAVMFEAQQEAVLVYKKAGIRIGKVQVSSAIKMTFGSEHDANQMKLQQLSSFSEPRYLHQTSIQDKSGSRFYEDLSEALQKEAEPDGEWRVHFHVPIFAEALGLIESTQSEIGSFMDSIRQNEMDVEHFEVETYAWNVLPVEHRYDSEGLADGIAKELVWFRENT